MMKMIFWNVQHGHAVYLKIESVRMVFDHYGRPIFPETKTSHIVFDLGTGTYGDSTKKFSPLLHLKDKYEVNRLDAVVITHPHGDHIYDIVNIDAIPPRVIFRPDHLTEQEIRNGNTTADQEYIDKYIDINRQSKNPVAENVDPFRKENNGGVNFQFFTPTKCSRSSLNNHSIITVISYGKSKIMIPGDNENPSWNELLTNPEFVTAIQGTDILLAPHHGRESGYSEALFQKMSRHPYLTIVSDGAETETSAVDRYSKKSLGWKVYKRIGTCEERKCLSTRNDGVIVLEFGLNREKKPDIKVTID